MCLIKRYLTTYINKNLHLLTLEIPPEITRGLLSGNFIILFAYTNAHSRINDPFGKNLGLMQYESVTCSFLLRKFYLDILCWIVLNFGNSRVLSALHSGIKLDCRTFTLCTEKNVLTLKRPGLLQFIRKKWLIFV